MIILIKKIKISVFKKFYSTASTAVEGFKYNNKENLISEWKNKVFYPIKQNGFALLEPTYQTPDPALELAELTGNIQHNRHTNNAGLSLISGGSNDAVTHVNSNLHFLPHTDGHYLNSFCQVDEKIFKLEPPRLVLLQCLVSNNTGGESLLYDGQTSIVSLLKEDINKAQALLCSYVSIMRHDILCANVPILQQFGDNQFKIRYSYDSNLIVDRNTDRILKKFNHHIEKSLILNQKLKVNQILLIDNTRLLHGRKTFSGERVFKRIWIAEKPKELYRVKIKEQMYVSSLDSRNPAIESSNKYKFFKTATHSRCTLRTGIVLPTKCFGRLFQTSNQSRKAIVSNENYPQHLNNQGINLKAS